MGIGWKPVREMGRTDPEQARLAEQEMEARQAGEAQEGGPLPGARAQGTHWREEVPKETFVAALRQMADALSQEEDFTFTIDHRFMFMRPIGTPAIEYSEIPNQRKGITFRFSWEA